MRVGSDRCIVPLSESREAVERVWAHAEKIEYASEGAHGIGKEIFARDDAEPSPIMEGEPPLQLFRVTSSCQIGEALVSVAPIVGITLEPLCLPTQAVFFRGERLFERERF